jgi:SPP1 gp7 family putative phage head morphogenesis protein
MDSTLISLVQHDQRRLERPGIAAAARLGAGLRKEALAGFREGRAPRIEGHLLRTVTPLLARSMLASYLQAYKRQRSFMRRSLGLRLAHGPVYERAIAALRRFLGITDSRDLERSFSRQALVLVHGASNHAQEQLKETIDDLITSGAHVREGVDVLRDKFDHLGLTPQKDYRLEGLFRTASQIAYNAGRWSADQDPDIQEILFGYRYATVGDDRVRPSHAELEGVTLPKDDPFWQRFWPPNGYNCRCTVIPLTEPEPIVEPPPGVKPEKGFGFNPGLLFQNSQPRLALSFVTIASYIDKGFASHYCAHV